MQPVVDYVTKFCLGCRVSTTQAAIDVCAAIDQAIGAAAEALGMPLIDEHLDQREIAYRTLYNGIRPTSTSTSPPMTTSGRSPQRQRAKMCAFLDADHFLFSSAARG